MWDAGLLVQTRKGGDVGLGGVHLQTLCAQELEIYMNRGRSLGIHIQAQALTSNALPTALR